MARLESSDDKNIVDVSKTTPDQSLVEKPAVDLRMAAGEVLSEQGGLRLVKPPIAKERWRQGV